MSKIAVQDRSHETQTRSMTVTKYHLDEAAKSLAVAKAHVLDAMKYDPDPDVTDVKLYPPILNNIALMEQYFAGRIIAGSYDLEREAGE